MPIASQEAVPDDVAELVHPLRPRILAEVELVGEVDELPQVFQGRRAVHLRCGCRSGTQPLGATTLQIGL